MPTYQYACTECDHAFEQVQSFTDSSLTECPACEGRLRKLFNAVGVVFKGSGFYRNDSRPAQGSDSSSSDTGSESKSGSKSETKTGSSETKSGTTSEKKSDSSSSTSTTTAAS